jgi:hypothetical protein
MAIQLGIHEFQFGIMFIVALCFGLITPPVGICLFAASSVSSTPVWPIAKRIVQFFVVDLIVIMCVIYFPELTLWLPLALAAVALLVVYGVINSKRFPPRRFAGLVTLMGISLGIPLVILLNPMWVQTQPPPPGQPLLTVLIDRSASMQLADNQGRLIDRAVAEARQIIAQADDRTRVEVAFFDDAVQPMAHPQVEPAADDEQHRPLPLTEVARPEPVVAHVRHRGEPTGGGQWTRRSDRRRA